MPGKIITNNDLVKEQLVTDLVSKMPDIEKLVFDEIMRFIDSFDSIGGNFSNGILTGSDLSEISLRIDDILKKSGYVQHVDLFMKDMNKVTINSSLVLDSEGFGMNRLPLSEMEQKWKFKTAETLLNSGINQDFKTPILNILDDAISYGDSITSTREKLKEFVIGGNDKSGKLQSYLTQTARDSVNQMQGQQMQSVADAIGYEGISYVGGLLKDSRGQCTHWIKDLNGFIPIEKLEEEIKLAYKNQAAKKVTDGVHKWGGMMPNTNASNFLVKRGGFNCTHSAIPKRKKPNQAQPKKEEAKVEVKPKFNQAKTVKEAEQRIKDLGVKKVDLSKLNVSQSNIVLKSIENESSFGKLDLNEVNCYRKSNSNAGALYSSSNNSISINASNISKVKPEILKSYPEQVDQLNGWIKKYTDEYLGNSKYNQKEVNSRINKYTEAKRKIEYKLKNGEESKHFTVMGMAKSDEEAFEMLMTHEIGHYRHYKNIGEKTNFNFNKKNAISDYGAYNDKEYLAEWFTYYRHFGEKNVPQDLLKLFKEIK